MEVNPRKKAVKILYEIEHKKAYSNLILNEELKDVKATVDQRFIRELVYGVLENKLYIDYVIRKFSKIRLKKINPMIMEILRIGVYQILFLNRVPDHAACDESVKIAKRIGHKRAQGFVNGILRNVTRKKDDIQLPDKNNDPLSYLSIKYSHPKWIVEQWVKDFGLAFTESLCRANNKKPPLNVRVNTLKITREDLIQEIREEGYKAAETDYADDGIVIKNPSKITEKSFFKKGHLTIQDESSMLVADVMNPKEGAFVIDVCSAPGGKATHIAQKIGANGKVLARDVHDHKLKLIAENGKRLGIHNIETQNYNALNLDQDLIRKADYCLVDAPCSGLGLLRRKPEIRWNKEPDDIQALVKLQYEILCNASEYVKENGVLVYSTCTITKEENSLLIKRFLNEHTEFKAISLKETLGNKFSEASLDNGYIELYPHMHDTDGFFICKMVRVR